jgi:hypothetical protein
MRRKPPPMTPVGEAVQLARTTNSGPIGGAGSRTWLTLTKPALGFVDPGNGAAFFTRGVASPGADGVGAAFGGIPRLAVKTDHAPATCTAAPTARPHPHAGQPCPEPLTFCPGRLKAKAVALVTNPSAV